jgi:hypothetical protein
VNKVTLQNLSRKCFVISRDITVHLGYNKRKFQKDHGNFIQTSMYMWHVGCRWHMSGHTQSPLIVKHLSHDSTKACIPAYKISASHCLRPGVKACFTSASDGNCLPARCFLRGPNRNHRLTYCQSCDWLWFNAWGGYRLPSLQSQSCTP